MEQSNRPFQNTNENEQPREIIVFSNPADQTVIVERNDITYEGNRTRRINSTESTRMQVSGVMADVQIRNFTPNEIEISGIAENYPGNPRVVSTAVVVKLFFINDVHNSNDLIRD